MMQLYMSIPVPCWDVGMHSGSTFPTPVFYCKIFPECHQKVEHWIRTPS